MAYLDMGVAGERFDARAGNPGFGYAMPFCPVMRVREMFFPEDAGNYISVEIRTPLEACAVIWPLPETEAPVLPVTGKRWRHSLVGGLLSILLHLSVGALAIGFLPAMLDLPQGSEAAIMVETIDEASFAALQEGAMKGADVPDLPLAEPVSPAEIQEVLEREAISAAVPAPDADVPMPKQSANLILPSPKPVEEETLRPLVEKKEKPPKPMVRKEKLAARGSETGSKFPGKQNGGADSMSTAAAVKGKASRTEGMGGTAALANLRARIIAHLGRHKRYPDAAVAMRMEGSVGVTFSIGTDGSLKSAAVNRSSGHGLLDREALAMLRRAQPFPVAADERGGQGLTITTQIGFVQQR